MSELCNNCGNSACFPAGYHCFKNDIYVEDEATCSDWKPRNKHSKEELERIRSVSELSLATRNL